MTRAPARLLPLIAVAAGVALTSCDKLAIDSNVGAVCASDEDCGDDVCGVDGDGARVCVPQEDCSTQAFSLTCAGDFLVGCSGDGEVVSIDCTNFFSDQPSPQLTCGEAPCAGECSPAVNTRCMAGAEGDLCTDVLANIFGGGKALCAESLACVLETEVVGLLQHCREEPTVCLPGDQGTCTASGRALNCFAENRAFALPPSAIECSTFADGGCVIAPDGSAVCLVGAGASCDGASIQCSDDLTCVGLAPSPPTFGACE